MVSGNILNIGSPSSNLEADAKQTMSAAFSFAVFIIFSLKSVVFISPFPLYVLVARSVTAFSAETGGVPFRCGQKVHLFYDFSRAFGVKSFFAVKNVVPFGIAREKIIRHKRI